eukprot:1810208-Rhodomonas_salina.2
MTYGGYGKLCYTSYGGPGFREASGAEGNIEVCSGVHAVCMRDVAAAVVAAAAAAAGAAEQPYRDHPSMQPSYSTRAATSAQATKSLSTRFDVSVDRL